MTGKTRNLIYAIPFAAVVLLLLVLNVSDPITGGPAIILLVFMLVYILITSLLFIGLHMGVGLVSKLWSKQRSANVREWRIGVQRAYYIASVVAFGPILLLAMQSVGQLQFRDVLLVVVLLGLAIFYVVKRS